MAISVTESLFEWLHLAQTPSEAWEILQGVLSGAYPGFAEEVTGTFSSKAYGFSERTTLSVEVTSQQFPDYSLNISRNGALLPWSTEASPPNIETVNPLSKNPTVLVNSTVDEPESQYASGLSAVEDIVAETRNFRAVAAGLFNRGQVSLIGSTSADHPPSSLSWTFDDQKA